MKVVYAMLRSHFQKRDGGAESLRNLVKGIGGKVEITVISSSTRGGDHYNGISYASSPWEGKRSDFRVLSFVRDFYHAVKKVLDSHDIIHLVLPNPIFSPLANALKKQTDKKVIVTYESLHYTDFSSFFSPALFYPENLLRLILFNRFLARMPQNRCDRYVVSSEFQKRALMKLGYRGEKVTAIPNCTDLKQYLPGEAGVLRQRYGIGGGSIVSYVGHFHYSKGVESLVRSFPAVLKKREDATLVLCWSGAGRGEKIRKLIETLRIEDRVVLMNKLVNVSEVLSLSDVFVLPYLHLFNTRIFPNLVFEAFAVGVPLVTTRVEPLPELIEEGETGLLVPPHDPASLSEAVLGLLEDKAVRERMRVNQRRVVRERYDAPVVAEQHYRMYQEVFYE